MSIRLDPRGLLVAPALIAPAAIGTAASAQLAVIDGRQFRQTIIEERRDGGPVQQFRTERRLTFHRSGNGFTVEIVIGPSSQPSYGAAGAMFAVAMTALEGQMIRFQLDGAGRITGIFDEDRIWAAFCEAVAGMGRAAAAGQGDRGRHIRGFAAPLLAIPPALRRQMLSSMLTPVLAGDAGAAGDRPVTLTARGIDGETVPIAATEHRAPAADGTIAVTVTARATLPARAVTPEAQIAITIRQRIDPATGLMLESRESRETTIGTGAQRRRSTSLSVMMLTPMVS